MVVSGVDGQMTCLETSDIIPFEEWTTSREILHDATTGMYDPAKVRVEVKGGPPILNDMHFCVPVFCVCLYPLLAAIDGF